MKTLTLSMLVVCGALAVASCAGSQAPVTANPSVSQVDATRTLAIHVADGTRDAINIVRTIRQAAQDLTKSTAHPENPIAAATMNTIDTDSIALGNDLQAALTSAEAVSADPSLKNTVTPLIQRVRDWIGKLPSAGALVYLVPLLRTTLDTLQTQIGA